MINDIETEWQISVMERGKSGVVLTYEGLKLLPYAKALCDEYRKLQIRLMN